MGTKKYTQSVEYLIGLLATEHNYETCDGRFNIRMRVAEALGEIGDTRALEPLKKVISDPDEGIFTKGATGCQITNGLTHKAAKDAMEKIQRNIQGSN